MGHPVSLVFGIEPSRQVALFRPWLGALCRLETIDSNSVTRMAADILGGTTFDIASLVNVSLLIPVTQRRRSNVPIRYSHRVFQEYFTALISSSTSLLRRLQQPQVPLYVSMAE